MSKGVKKKELLQERQLTPRTSRSPASMPSVPIGRKADFGQSILMLSQKSSADDTIGTPPVRTCHDMPWLLAKRAKGKLGAAFAFL